MKITIIIDSEEPNPKPPINQRATVDPKRGVVKIEQESICFNPSTGNFYGSGVWYEVASAPLK